MAWSLGRKPGELGRWQVAKRTVFAVVVVEADVIRDPGLHVLHDLVDVRPDLLFLQGPEVPFYEGVLSGFRDVDELGVDVQDLERSEERPCCWLTAIIGLQDGPPTSRATGEAGHNRVLKGLKRFAGPGAQALQVADDLAVKDVDDVTAPIFLDQSLRRFPVIQPATSRTT